MLSNQTNFKNQTRVLPKLSAGNFVIIRMWKPKFKNQETSYPKAMLKGMTHSDQVNVGHISISIFHNNVETYASHWPGEDSEKSRNNTLAADLSKEGEGCDPSSYIILHSLNIKKMLQRFEEIKDKAWDMKGDKKGRIKHADVAYSCSSFVYDILTAGGIFNQFLDENNKLKHPITPIEVAEFATKAQLIENRLYFPQPNVLLKEFFNGINIITYKI